MAEQDFNIKVITTADTTGIKQTSVELDKLRQQQATFAETARRQAAAAAAVKPAPQGGTIVGGVTGTAIGVGTIITVLTKALNQWKEFNAEQDKWVDGMIKAQEQSRALGLALADMMDAMKSAERIDTEPLQSSFDRLTQRVRVLKTEMNIAFGAGEYEDVKRIAAALGVVESQVNRVTAALERQKQASAKAAADFAKDAASAPQPTELEKLQQRVKKFSDTGGRSDLTPAEQSAARDEYVKAQSDLRDAQIQDVKDQRDQQAELTRRRYEGPGEGTLRREDYFTKGPGAAGADNTSGATLQEILNYMKSVWGY